MSKIRKPEGPDQLRSWAIAMAACVINTLLSGITRGSGLFYVAFIDVYGCTRMEANMPFTLRNCIRNLSGPLVGAFGQKYGVKAVTATGSILAGLGVSLCAFAPNVIWICAMWGGLHGFGVALANTLFGVTLNQYFVKYRATASGIALSGACFGSLVLPAALSYLLSEYGLPGTFLLTGAILLNALPAALALQEPPWLKTKIKETTISVIAIKDEKIVDSMLRIPEDREVVYSSNCDVSASNVNELIDSKKQYNNSRARTLSNEEGQDNPALVRSSLDLRERATDQVDDIFEPRLRTVSTGEASIFSPAPQIDTPQETSFHKAIKRVITDPMFHMISLSLAAFAMLFDPTITVIVDYIMDKGMDEEVAKYLISMMSLGDLFGRLCLGWVTDKNYMSMPKFMMLCHVAQGVCLVLTTVFNSLEVLLALMIAYGVTSGAALVMYPILVAKYLPSVQSLAIGCISFFTGIVSFSAPPLIGHFRDDVGSYDGMFVITGGTSIIVGFLWLLEPLLMRLNLKAGRSGSVFIST